MLSTINSNSQGPYKLSTSLPRGDNNATLVKEAVQLLESPSLYKQPSNQLDLIERLYRQELLPHMESSGQPFIKVSRRAYVFLQNSILANREEVFEQYHWNDKEGSPVTSIEKKGLLGEGACKRVWELKSLYPSSSPEMVRTRFHWTLSRSDVVKKQLKKIEKFKNTVNTRFLLIPDSSTYAASCGFEAIVQMMPRAAGGDLFHASKRMSYLGRMLAIHSLGLALTDMHIKNWVHLSVKPHNIMLMNQDLNSPISKLSDFDFVRKFETNTAPYFAGTPRYMDPKCLKNESRGLEDAKIHDQFSFGVTLYEVLTGNVLRKSFQQELLKEWVKEEDLNTSPSFAQLNESIQSIIRQCCLGPADTRPYKLLEFLSIIEGLIKEGAK